MGGCRRRLTNTWYKLWNSNTSISNYSGESVPKFTIGSELSVWEYMYKNVPSIPPKLLWSTSINMTGDDIEFQLSDMGCMSLSDGDTNWELCTSFTTSTSATIIEDTVDVLAEAVEDQSDDGTTILGLSLVWFIFCGLLVLCAVLLVLRCFVTCRLECMFRDSDWVGSREIVAADKREHEQKLRHETMSQFISVDMQLTPRDYVGGSELREGMKSVSVESKHAVTAGDGDMETVEQLDMWANIQ